MKSELSYTPSDTFETGLKKTIQWYRDNPGGVERIKSGEYLQWMRKKYGQ